MPNPMPSYYGRAYFRYLWSDPWVPIPGVVPLNSEFCLAPGESQATLSFDYGNIKREGSNTFNVESPLDLLDYYVKISKVDSADGPEIAPLWYGVIPRQSDIKLPQSSAGRITFKALGLEHLLDRRTVTGAYVTNSFNATKEEKIGWFPGFNEAIKKGMKGTEGNRSWNTAPVGSYVFGDSGKAWNAYEAMRYILDRYPPVEGIDWQFAPTSQYEALFDIEEIWSPPDNMSIWEWMKILMDRRRGVCFYLWPRAGQGLGQESPIIDIHVHTIVNESITIGSRELPANNKQTTFAAFNTHPERHITKPIEFSNTVMGNYDTIQVEGDRMVVIASMDYFDTQAIKEGWSIEASDMKRYHDASETHRASDFFAGYFTRFRISSAWDRKIRTIFSANCDEAINLKCDEMGVVTANGLEDGGSMWKGRQRLQRTMPIMEGADYSTNPPLFAGGPADPTGNPKEFADWKPLMVFIKLPVEIPGGGANVWRLVDKLADNNTGLPSCHVRPLDKEFGFELSCSPRHIFAKDGWPVDANGAFKNVQQVPRLRYKEIGLTAAIKCDERLRVMVNAQTGQYTDQRGYRHLDIQVPGAEYWRILTNTVVGINNNGSLAKVHNENKILRDDREMLEGIAGFASGWYGKKRQSAVIPLQRIEPWVELGSLLNRITGDYNQEVNTVVSSIKTDYRNLNVEVQTGWGDFDLMGAILDEKKGPLASRESRVEHLGMSFERDFARVAPMQAKDPPFYARLVTNAWPIPKTDPFSEPTQQVFLGDIGMVGAQGFEIILPRSQIAFYVGFCAGCFFAGEVVRVRRWPFRNQPFGHNYKWIAQGHAQHDAWTEATSGVNGSRIVDGVAIGNNVFQAHYISPFASPGSGLLGPTFPGAPGPISSDGGDADLQQETKWLWCAAEGLFYPMLQAPEAP